MKRVAVLFALGIMVMTSAAVHDFHVSITKIDLNPESKKLEIMIKLFTDDLSEALNQKYGTNFMLGTASEPPNANDRLKEYVNGQFSISVNGKPVELNYLGKQQEDDATWVYIESERVGKIRSMAVSNPLLTDLFDDQANLINVKVEGKKGGLTLRKGETTGEVKFN